MTNENIIKINGKISYENTETGFWSIIDKNGKTWRIINAPEELKKENLNVCITAEPIDEEFSVFMRGKPIKIIKFEIIN